MDKTKYEMDAEGFVAFNADRSLGQNQYASRFVDGRHGNPYLGKGLRWKGIEKGYHFIRIHADDLGEFHRRVNEFRRINPGY